MESVLLVLAGIYLLTGFSFAIYVVMNKGQGIFSIPLNTLLGPITVPFTLLISYVTLLKRLERKAAARKKENE